MFYHALSLPNRKVPNFCNKNYIINRKSTISRQEYQPKDINKYRQEAFDGKLWIIIHNFMIVIAGGIKMKKDDCIFCKIAAGEIPSATIYEDESFRVILDIAPASKGHAIILPKKHGADIFELEEEDCTNIFLVAAKVSKAMKEVLHCDGLNVLQNNGEAAGQTVFHFHMHLIPRYIGDKVSIAWKCGEYLDDDKEKILKSLKDRMSL